MAGRQWQVYYGYSLWSILSLVALIPFVVVIPLRVTFPALLGDRLEWFALMCAEAVLATVSVYVTLRVWNRSELPEGRGMWDLPRAGILRGGTWGVVAATLPVLIALLLLLLPGADPRLLLVLLLSWSTTLLVRIPWWWSLLTLPLASLIGIPLGAPIEQTLPAAGILVGFISGMRGSLWLIAMVRELDELRTTQAQLAVAEERLRFARDLHDVTGRDLSTIAVKAELVTRLVEHRDPRAIEHSQEVTQIARSSLARTRGLVRGYREADLAAELQGTASLLRSAHIEVRVDGETGAVGAQDAETAAWALREAGTNILRHADATDVHITLAPGLLTVTSDGVRDGDGDVTFGSGLRGLVERVGADGQVRARIREGRFTLSVDFPS